MNSSRPVSSFDDKVEVLSRVSSVPRVQISRSFARFSAGKSEELSSGPVQSSRPLGFGQILSNQPAASRLEHSVLDV
ncbi:hypothetical protein F2Q70_00012344 [Brassica cretica]|uniref:Uncharacterized protein n=1 Tax=Brassica cretica TaxID=69181 RepID=A0A8S9M6R8_BRACR|nr:hypothetical protein F2Q70_00012344 [Brassica cretica]